MKKNKKQFEIFETTEGVIKLFRKIEDNANKNIVVSLNSIANKMNGLILSGAYKIEKILSIKYNRHPSFYFEIKLIFFSKRKNKLDYFSLRISDPLDLLNIYETLKKYEDKKRKEKINNG